MSCERLLKKSHEELGNPLRARLAVAAHSNEVDVGEQSLRVLYHAKLPSGFVANERNMSIMMIEGEHTGESL